MGIADGNPSHAQFQASCSRCHRPSCEPLMCCGLYTRLCKVQVEQDLVLKCIRLLVRFNSSFWTLLGESNCEPSPLNTLFTHTSIHIHRHECDCSRAILDHIQSASLDVFFIDWFSEEQKTKINPPTPHSQFLTFNASLFSRVVFHLRWHASVETMTFPTQIPS